jgi:hypothetical protein
MAGENPEIAVVLRLLAEQFQTELKKNHGLLGDFGKALSDWKVQLTAVGGALFAIAKSTANAGEEALKGAQKTGLAVEAYQQIAYAAKLADVEQGQLLVGLKSLSTAMVEAAQGGQEQKKTFDALKLSATDATGQLKPTEQVLLEVADRFAHMENGAVKSALAVKLFGKSGLDLIPFLNQGKAGIQAMMEEARTLGIVMSEKDAQAANEFNDGLKRLQTSVRAIVLDLGTKLIPVLIQLAELVTTIMTRGRANVLDEMLKGWAGLFVLLTHAIRETSLELEVFYKKLGAAEAVKKFWNDVLVQTRKDLDARRDQELRDIFEGRSSAKTTPLKSGKADVFVPNVTVSAEQAKKKSQEIFDDLEREEKDRLARLHLAAPTYDLGTIQEGLGKAERANFLAAQQQAQTWIDAYQKEEDAALARLDAEIDAYGKAQEAMGRFIVQRTQKERLEQMSVLELYRFGLQEYLTNYGNTFNIAIDMARQTAQAMSQGFKTFFFDFMQGRITSLQDAFRGLVNFVQQVIAEVLARLATAKLLGLFATGAAGVSGSQGAMMGSGLTAASGGQVARRFAIGGPVFSNGDSVPALLTPGEYVISNRGVDALNRLNQGDPGGFARGGPGNVVVNIHNAPPGTGADVSVLRRSQDFVINVILRDLRQNGPLRQALGAA